MIGKIVKMAAPALAGAMLLGMSSLDKLRVDRSEAASFHVAAERAVKAAPKVIGPWYAGKEIPLPSDAAEMLHANAYLHRPYANLVTGQSVQLLLVQCRETEDMQGHFPPICYRNAGCLINFPGDCATWRVGEGLEITGCEYGVTWPNGARQYIRDFFILPNGKIVPDMEGVNAAAKDYRELAYGVAQVQLLFDASVGGAERDAIFSTLIGANRPLIDVLRNAANLIPRVGH